MSELGALADALEVSDRILAASAGHELVGDGELYHHASELLTPSRVARVNATYGTGWVLSKDRGNQDGSGGDNGGNLHVAGVAERPFG